MGLLALPLAMTAPATHAGDPLEACNVTWASPSADQNGSMPIGNGDFGANVWMEPDGNLVLLLGKTDAWDGNAELLKLGRVRLSFAPNPVAATAPFTQSLRLRQGEIAVSAGAGESAIALRIWVDAHRPVLRVEATSPAPFGMRAELETWRQGQTIVTNRPDRVVWYQRNEQSLWRENLEHQGVGDAIPRLCDPLLHRTFGGAIEGAGFSSESSVAVASREPARNFVLSIHPLCAQTETIAAWETLLAAQVEKSNAAGISRSRRRHADWWNEFWERSWIRVSGFPDAAALTQGYALQRWMNACGGRGAAAIKFNGSIFTVNAERGGDPDARAWGGQYWWQNTRLTYWPMPACGDSDLMQSLFGMYAAMIPLAERRSQAWFGHDGAVISEIVYPWGMLNNGIYGEPSHAVRQARNLPPGDLKGTFAGYIRREYTASPELMAMMLDAYDYTRDETFLRETLLPMCDSLLRFWERHYPVGPDGRLVLFPAQVLETYWEARNPAPDVAGLHWVLGKLLEIPEAKTGAARRACWRDLLSKIPPLPIGERDGKRILLGAEWTDGKTHNGENGNLYAVFPFRLYGVGKPDLDLARFSFERRLARGDRGWVQTGVQAAFLGLSREAAADVVSRARDKNPASRFPAFWVKHADEVPNQCHGGNLMMALQAMLMQPDDGLIRLLPAWPSDWDADFKLHAPGRTVVRGSLRGGKIVALDVTPKSRRKDVRIAGERVAGP